MMNSLINLSTYNDSESDNDNVNENEIECEVENKHEGRLPLPKFLVNSEMHKISVREENSDGKVRNFPHEPGNWATYIYLPLDSSKFLDYIKAIRDHFHSLNLKLVDDFHISLTRTVILRHHWILDFTKTVQKSVKEISAFKIHLNGLKAYTNEQKSRSFLSLGVDEGESHLKAVVSELDNCLRDYSLESFYENPSFHVSLLWCPGDRCNDINEYIQSLPLKLKNFGFNEKFSHCVCASGNKKFNFYFHE